MRQVEEQVEAFDQCGWYGHGGHAVHSFLTVKEETEARSSPLIHITIFQILIQPAKQNKASLVQAWKIDHFCAMIHNNFSASKKTIIASRDLCVWECKNECVPLKMIHERYEMCVL